MCAASSSRITVYPRVCGETMNPLTVGTCTPGLSPRVRGNPHSLHSHGYKRGSIPACAGKPTGSGFPYAERRVYPRVCGETTLRRHGVSEDMGLSRVCGETTI